MERGDLKHLMSQYELKHPFSEYFCPDPAFVVITQSNLRYPKSPKPNQLDMRVMEQENATGPVPPVSTVVSDNYEIVEDKGRHAGNLSLFPLLLLFFLSPAWVLLHHCCLCHVSVSSCKRQRKGDGEAHTSSYAKPFSTSFRVMCLCSSEFPLMLNNQVRPPCF